MEIVPGIHRVDGINANCYIIAGKDLVLIDTGLPKSSGKILSYIREVMKRTPEEIRTIILTHYHVDHSGGTAELKASGGAKVAIHEADGDFLAGIKPMPLPPGFIGLALRVLDIFYRFRPVRPDMLLHDGDEVCGLRCIHTPGHTPGSICLFDPERRIAFSGDTVLVKKGKLSGPPHGVTADMDSARTSWQRILDLEPGLLLPGHGEPWRPVVHPPGAKTGGGL